MQWRRKKGDEMDIRQQAYERLSQAKVIEGVLPTKRVERGSRAFEPLVRSLREDSSEAGFERYAFDLATMPPAAATAPPPMLLETEALREQAAGFAGAGLLFFEAPGAMIDMPLEVRGAVGGNGSVTRVLLSEERLLLETPRVVVRFNPGVGEDEQLSLLERHGLVPIGALPFLPGAIRAAVLNGRSLDVSLELLSGEEAAVEFAEPDFIEHVGQRYWPGDPLMATQWHLRNDGSDGGTAGADISAEQAWDVATGQGVRLAIVDNGFDTLHGDLRFGRSSGWFRQTTDFQDSDFVPGTVGMPSGNHGTACAGMAGGRADNGRGACGVAWASDTSMIACLKDQVGTQATLARAIAQAADPSLELGEEAGPGADVICCSLGPNSATWGLSATLRAAIEFVATQARDGLGVPLFWACTNGNYPISADKVCSHPDVIAVGRSSKTDSDDNSGFGPELDFLAPGVKVHLPVQGNGYATGTGTSFAAPCAAGVAALMLAKTPTHSAAAIRQLLRDTCDKIGPLPYVQQRNDRFGYGRVNAKAAVDAA